MPPPPITHRTPDQENHPPGPSLGQLFPAVLGSERASAARFSGIIDVTSRGGRVRPDGSFPVAVLLLRRVVLAVRRCAFWACRPSLSACRSALSASRPRTRCDAGEVDSLGDQGADPAEPGDVGVAVPADAAAGAGRCQQAHAFVEPEGLHTHPGQLGGHRDAVHPGAAVAGRHRRVRWVRGGNRGHPPCLVSVSGVITNLHR
jgi:hypothetical protein